MFESSLASTLCAQVGVRTRTVAQIGDLHCDLFSQQSSRHELRGFVRLSFQRLDLSFKSSPIGFVATFNFMVHTLDVANEIRNDCSRGPSPQSDTKDLLDESAQRLFLPLLGVLLLRSLSALHSVDYPQSLKKMVISTDTRG